MIKVEISVQKRSRPTTFEDFMQKKSRKIQKHSVEALKMQNLPKFDLQDFEKKEDWKSKQEETLLLSILEIIIEEPYLQFGWEFFQEQPNWTKISKKLNRSAKSCIVKLNEIKSVNRQKYSDLDLIEFLPAYWKAKNFKSKQGREMIRKIKSMKQKQSNHMQMCDQIIQNMTIQKSSFQSLYSLIMGN